VPLLFQTLESNRRRTVGGPCSAESESDCATQFYASCPGLWPAFFSDFYVFRIAVAKNRNATNEFQPTRRPKPPRSLKLPYNYGWHFASPRRLLGLGTRRERYRHRSRSYMLTDLTSSVFHPVTYCQIVLLTLDPRARKHKAEFRNEQFPNGAGELATAQTHDTNCVTPADLLLKREAEPRTRCVPRQSLGTRLNSGEFSYERRGTWGAHSGSLGARRAQQIDGVVGKCGGIRGATRGPRRVQNRLAVRAGEPVRPWNPFLSVPDEFTASYQLIIRRETALSRFLSRK
jgi:hypothetical protein